MTDLDILIEDGNPHAIGIYARGAQGVSVQNCDITLQGTEGIGLQGGAGSGGSHINVKVIGGAVGMDVSQAQPSPTLTGISLINQSRTSLIYHAPGRQTLSLTGINIELAPYASGPAISTEFPISMVDSQVGYCSSSGAAPCGCPKIDRHKDKNDPLLFPSLQSLLMVLLKDCGA